MAERPGSMEWRAGWPLVLTGVVGTTCVGAHVYPLGVMMKPLTAAFGWSRAEISMGATISSLMTLVLSTFVGILLDRYGPRRVAMVGTPLAAAVIATVGLTGPSVWTWIAAWSAYALVVVLILPIVWGAAIASAFQVSRGLALGLGLSGSGIASVVYPPLTLWLLHTFGLRGVYPGLGAFILLTLGPLVVFAFRPPVARAVAKGATDVRAWGHTLPEAMRTGLLWRIVLVLAAAAIVSSAINVHLQPLLTDRGFSTVQAASIAAAIGPSVLFGRWVGGLLLDRLHARWIALAFYLLPALGCLLLVGSSGTYLRGLVSAVLIGLSVGVEGDLLPFLLSRYFGVRHFGAIYGLGMAVFGAGYAIGPLAAGALFDRSGSYDVFLMTIAATLAVAGLVTLSFGAYPSSPNAGPASAGVEQG